MVVATKLVDFRKRAEGLSALVSERSLRIRSPEVAGGQNLPMAQD